MINYRVENLEDLLRVLKEEGVKVDDKVEQAEYGKFAWIYDPDGIMGPSKGFINLHTSFCDPFVLRLTQRAPDLVVRAAQEPSSRRGSFFRFVS
jgi:hypothetical protein